MSRRFPLGPPADIALIAAFIVLAILGYVVLFRAAGGAFLSPAQTVPLPAQYP
ncbi:MAG: hypothetical protein ACLQJR_17455 [Stellaceae bacterium]